MENNELMNNYDVESFNKNVSDELVATMYQNEEKREEPKKVLPGDYIIAITEMYIGQTRNGKNALKATFTISDGELRGSNMSYTQVLSVDFTIKKAIDFLNSLGTDVKITKNITEIDVKNVFLKIKDNCEFDIKYWKNDKNFDEYKITGIYDLK